MKFLKQIIVPVFVLMLGAGAALATNVAKQSENLVEKGHYYDATAWPVQCIQTTQDCEESGNSVCRFTENGPALMRYVNDTSCGITLRRNL